MRRVGALLVTSVLLSGCGEAPPPPAAPPPVVLAAPQPDLSPVAEPKTLLAVARWKDPLHGVERALSLVKKPMALEALLAKEAPEVVKALRLDASFDVAIALDPSTHDDEPKFLVAASIPLASFADAKAAVEKRWGTPEERAPGVLHLPGKSGEKAQCDIAMAVGDAPARLVCGLGQKDLDTLRDYLVRGLPHAAPAKEPLEASVHFRVLKDRYVGRLRAAIPEGENLARAFLSARGVKDAELLATPGIVMDEGLKFVGDLDRLDLRFSLRDKPTELVAGTTLRFEGHASWLTQLLAESADHRQSAPAMFWRVPRDASSVSWGQAADPARFEGIRRVLHQAIDVALESTPLQAADRRAITAFVDAIPRASGTWVTAHGLLHRPLDPNSARTPLAEAKLYGSTVLGWTLVGTHGAPGPYVAWAKQGKDLYDRLVRVAKQMAKTQKEKEVLGFAPTLTTVNDPSGWPKGTTALDLKVTFNAEIAGRLLPSKFGGVGVLAEKRPKPPTTTVTGGPKESVTIRLVFVPDGDDTWIGLSGDGAELLKQTKIAMRGAPEAATIAGRADLAPLHGGDVVSAGFVTFGGAIEDALLEMKKNKSRHLELGEALTAALPNHGATPILYSSSATGGKAPSVSFDVRLEQGTLEDIASAVMFLLSERGRKLGADLL